ncbi:alpha/beta fold hydrolase [Nocardia vinacea]|uniref:alpha/beta fold hydrolase n=1 Tax=Nocardia vinacea TaxID=96468 RepID=UPI0007C466F7|nr:alpha/beta hydrolase [Nocardia vinacea]
MTNIALKTEVHGSGPGVLLAHGAGGSIADNFGSLIPVLATNHTVVAPDYPADDTVLELDALADALVAEAVERGVGTFTIVGYSLGAAVAVRAAVRHPDRVRALVLAAGFAKGDNRFRLAAQIWADTVERGESDVFARFILNVGYSARFLNSLSPNQIDELRTLIAAHEPGGTVPQVRLAKSVDTTDDLQHIAVPTLVVNATADLLVDPNNSRALAEGISGAKYIEIDAGHVLMIERPEEWIRTISDYLSDNPGCRKPIARRTEALPYAKRQLDM